MCTRYIVRLYKVLPQQALKKKLGERQAMENQTSVKKEYSTWGVYTQRQFNFVLVTETLAYSRGCATLL